MLANLEAVDCVPVLAEQYISESHNASRGSQKSFFKKEERVNKKTAY